MCNAGSHACDSGPSPGGPTDAFDDLQHPLRDTDTIPAEDTLASSLAEHDPVDCSGVLFLFAAFCLSLLSLYVQIVTASPSSIDPTNTFDDLQHPLRDTDTTPAEDTLASSLAEHDHVDCSGVLFLFAAISSIITFTVCADRDCISFFNCAH